MYQEMKTSEMPEKQKRALEGKEKDKILFSKKEKKKILNSERLNDFLLSSGIKQGYLLSTPIHYRVEVLVNAIWQEKEDVQITNKMLLSTDNMLQM